MRPLRHSMWKALVLLCTLLCWHHGQGQPPPCEARTLDTGLARKACADVKPVSGTILLKNTAGLPCTCDCLALPHIYPDYDSLQHQLNLAFTRRKSTWGSLFFSASSDSCPPDPLRLVVAEGGTVIPCPGSRSDCPVDNRTAELAAHLIGVLASDGSPVSTISVQDGAYAKLWPVISNGGITIPRRFLDEPAVGEELITFMLLHEAHHAMEPDATEIDHDRWAAGIGLPRFFGARWNGMAGTFLDRLTCQLRGYYQAIYQPEAINGTIRAGGAIYPAMECRADAILRAVYHQPIGPECTADTVDLVDHMFRLPGEHLQGCNTVCPGCQWDFSPVLAHGTLLDCPQCTTTILGRDLRLRCPGPYAFCQLPDKLVVDHLHNRMPGADRVLRKLQKADARQTGHAARLDQWLLNP